MAFSACVNLCKLVADVEVNEAKQPHFYCNVQRCMLQLRMIKNFKHKGLKRLHEHGDGSKVRADQLERIRDVLSHLENAKDPRDLDLPGYHLHALKGDLKGYWSVKISGNWRIIFRFREADAFDVGLIDYH